LNIYTFVLHLVINTNQKFEQMKNSACPKVYKSGEYEYLYVYYRGKDVIKRNTGFKVKKTELTKDCFFKKNDYMNSLLMEKINEVNKYLTHCYSYKEEITNKGLNEFIKRNSRQYKPVYEPLKTELSVMKIYEKFVELKKGELINHYNSIRVYNSLTKSLQRYSDAKGLTFEKMNTLEFLYDFRIYSNTELKHLDNTVSKNVNLIKQFYKYCRKNKIYDFNPDLQDYKIERSRPHIISLTRDELQSIFDCTKYNQSEQRVIDVFIFLCLTSLRFSDYRDLDNATIENNNIIKLNLKTKKEIIVPLNATTLNILEKYEHKLPQFSNPYLNRELKIIFKKYKLLNTVYKKPEIRGGEIVINKKKEGMKYEFITVHKSRATFITLLLNDNTPETEIMSATGQSFSTLNSYVDSSHNPELTKKLEL